MAEVLTTIREDLGTDAVILHTRTFKRGGMLGLGGKTIVEVTASTAAYVGDARSSQSRGRPARLAEKGSASAASAEPATTEPVNSAGRPAPARRPLFVTSSATERPDPDGSSIPRGAVRNPAATDVNDQRARVESLLEKSKSLIEQSRGSCAPALNGSSRDQGAVKNDDASGRGPFAPVSFTPAVRRGEERQPPNSATAAANNAAAADQQLSSSRTAAAAPVARRFVIDPNTGRAEAPPNAIGSNPVVQAPSIAADASPLTARPQARSTSDQGKASPASGETNTQINSELSALRRMVGQVLQRQSGSTQLSMPQELFKMYLSLIENDVAQDLADEICAQVRDELSTEQLADSELVRETLLKRLAALIPTATDESSGSSTRTQREGDRPLTIAFVGPTGVGKTTTVAKLAASYKLRQGRRVGLITTDTYRIAAVDQLRTYANIIGVPLKVALTPEEMADACRELGQCDVILIDTAGRSPGDSQRIDEARRFLEAAAPHQTHLVLSSAASESVMIRTVERFAPVKADQVIFTKLDEAVSFGVVINVMRRLDKRLSFVTTGQEVPDHIEPGQPDRLARLVLGEKLIK